MAIIKYLLNRKNIIEREILKHIPGPNRFTKGLRDAVRYSLMSGGKRIRPILVLAACEAVSGGYKKALPAAVAIEMIHTYTLIHDDLPAMDNDDMRRGKPTCHRKFGEYTAILAGDMLNTLAFELISDHYRQKASLIISDIAKALGIEGVVGGQYADLRAKGMKTGKNEQNFIDKRKTACLFMASVRCGAMIGGAGSKELGRLTDYAEHLGLAFQIIDDILDYGSGTRPADPAIHGNKRLKLEAETHIRSAIDALPQTQRFGRLRELALFLSNRKE